MKSHWKPGSTTVQKNCTYETTSKDFFMQQLPLLHTTLGSEKISSPSKEHDKIKYSRCTSKHSTTQGGGNVTRIHSIL
jgi:hypothetical protein